MTNDDIIAKLVKLRDIKKELINIIADVNNGKLRIGAYNHGDIGNYLSKEARETLKTVALSNLNSLLFRTEKRIDDILKRGEL